VIIPSYIFFVLFTSPLT